MDISNENTTEDGFQRLYEEIYRFLLEDYRNREGKELETYKEYEPEYLVKFIRAYKDEDDLMDQASSILSHLILLQALPNANHRAAFLFLHYYLAEEGILMQMYRERKNDYDIFYKGSKEIIDKDINHHELFNENYHDVIHTAAIERHLCITKELLEKIIELPQSGIVTVESLHRFITSRNQAGSLPGSNHRGASF